MTKFIGDVGAHVVAHVQSFSCKPIGSSRPPHTRPRVGVHVTGWLVGWLAGKRKGRLFQSPLQSSFKASAKLLQGPLRAPSELSQSSFRSFPKLSQNSFRIPPKLIQGSQHRTPSELLQSFCEVPREGFRQHFGVFIRPWKRNLCMSDFLRMSLTKC